jgi:hypothetical protein
MSYHEETYKGCTIRLEQDETPWNPREDCDPAGKMVCWHHRYNLGEKHDYASPTDFILQLAAPYFEAKARLLGIETDDYDDYLDPLGLSDEESFKQAREYVDKNYVILPLYLYDHGGLSMSTGKFSCPWDSRQVGYIYISFEQARKEWPSDTLEESIERATRCLKAEVSEYDAFMRGDVVNRIVEDEEGEEIDSCWGYFPDEKGNFDYVIEEARHIIDSHLKHQDKLAIELCANI